jgi:signal transduction histidine kinase
MSAENVSREDPGMVGAEQQIPQPRGSIRARLPILIAGLLAASVAAFAALAYNEVERSFIATSRERVQGVARQLSQLLGQSVQPRMEEARRVAGRPGVRALLSTPASAGDAGTLIADAVSDIQAFLKTNPQTLAVDVWDANGRRVLGVPATPAAGAPSIPPAALITSRPTGTGISPLHDHGDNLVTFDVVGAVAGADPAGSSGAAANPLGFVVLRRRASTPGAAAAVGQLLGGSLSVQFGTRRDGVWTDLSRVTPPPPAAALSATGAADYTDPAGKARIGAAASIPGTPWVVWVSTLRTDALTGVRAFLWRLGLVGLATIIVGAVVGWWLAGRVTGPLVEVTHAAEAIAGGDLSRRVPPGQRNEVGRLGHAFNVMATRVEDGYARLDARVQERTRELEATLQTLKETQESLVRREKLAMLGQLASGVGHELRNPLGVMTNAVYYLELVQPDAPEEIREYHGILKSQIGLAERIVSDLLDFSRIRPPQRQEVSLARLVDEQLVRLGRVEGVTIKNEVPEDLPTAHIDPVQVGQVILNLLLNAAQAMEDTGGVLTVRGRLQDDGVAIDVIDTGPGVAPELREKIFEALFTTRARGIGLGLAVSRSLAVANSGTLSVTNTPEGGAMFTLVSPAVRAEVTT